MFVATADFAASGSASGASVKVDPASTSISLTESAAKLVYGQPETLTAKVSNTGGTAALPTGTVQFYDNSVSPARLLGQTSLVNGVATLPASASSSPLLLAVGVHNITASYVGNTSFSPSGPSDTVNATVSLASTTTTLTSSTPGPTSFGTAITFTATVANASGTSPLPTGSVKFYVDYNPAATTNTLLGSASLSGGVATLTTATMPAGNHTVTAVYAGSTSFATSVSTSILQPVNPEGTTAALSSTASGTVSSGASVTFTVVVADVDAGLRPPPGPCKSTTTRPRRPPSWRLSSSPTARPRTRRALSSRARTRFRPCSWPAGTIPGAALPS